MMTQNPDPRTAPDDAEDATDGAGSTPTNRGQSAELPAEGADNDPPENDGSPQG
jgi:hypothetical protein